MSDSGDDARVKATPETLDDLIGIDCPFIVHNDGTVTLNAPGIYAPESMLDDSLGTDAWETWSDGRSNQWAYRGPVMHNSEFIGPRMAEDLLAEPGTYCLIGAEHTPEDEDEDEDEDDGDGDDPEIISEGWVIVRLKEIERND